LLQQLNTVDLGQLSVEKFLQLLVNTKKPLIFAESAVFGDGRDWTRNELSLLGDISVAVPVTVYDNARHHQPTIHSLPFKATLLYTPGALLRNDSGHIPADWPEIVQDNKINFDNYYRLYERRLLPGLRYADQLAGSLHKSALLTIPGLGCGQFAGPFKGQLGAHLKNVLIRILERHGKSFTHIRALYYDPYNECGNERLEINGVTLLVRPLTMGNHDKAQLCAPVQYAEEADDFSSCLLFSVVAWDPVSWPGNDFYTGSRLTDDGVKAAATSSMQTISGIEGHYNRHTFTYDPPAPFRHWLQVIRRQHILLHLKNNLRSFPQKNSTVMDTL
jgi:hypothetical protein